MTELHAPTEPEWRDVSNLRAMLESSNHLVDYHGGEILNRLDEAPTVDALSIPWAQTSSEIARLFHDTYERLAPQMGYETREASAVPWEQVPQANRDLMIATVVEVRTRAIVSS